MPQEQSSESQFLRAVGVQWTIFVVAASIVIEALGAENELDIFSLAVGAAVGFATVFAATRPGSPLRPKTLIAGAVAAAVVLPAIPLVILWYAEHITLSGAIHRWERPVSICLGIVIGIAGGLIIQALRRNAVSGLPKELRSAVLEIANSDLVLDYMHYEVVVEDIIGNMATFVYDVEFLVRNRTYHEITGHSTYGHLLSNIVPIEASVGARQVDLNVTGPNHLYGGMAFAYSIPPMGEQIVRAKFSSEQSLPWSDVFSVYRPCRELTLRLQDKREGIMRVRLHSQLKDVTTEETADTTIIRANDGVMPFNGVIVSWGPAAVAENDGSSGAIVNATATSG